MKRKNKKGGITEYVYHYTCQHHLPAIVNSGYITLTENNLSSVEERIPPLVVWLTSDTDPTKRHGLDCGLPPPEDIKPIADKTRIMFYIKKQPHFHHWYQWSRKHKIDKHMDEFLRGHGHNFMSWFVSEKIIPLSEVEKIVDRYTGETIWEVDQKWAKIRAIDDLS